MKRVAVIGGGPAGLMAAETLAAAGCKVVVYDAMPSVGRKLLLAGKSGLNLTHAEAYEEFVSRYDFNGNWLRSALDEMPPSALVDWVTSLGIETFVGSSGRVFPKTMKGSPLLRAWLSRLDELGVEVRPRHRWVGFQDEKSLVLQSLSGNEAITPDAVVLALGGASWPKLGSDGSWVPTIEATGAKVTPLAPSNCGFDVAWSEHFRSRNSGLPVKSVIASVAGKAFQGEFVVTETGIEGSLVYAHAAALREALAAGGPAVLTLNLTPGRDLHRLIADLAKPRGKASFSNYLRKAAGLDGVKAALLRECGGSAIGGSVEALATTIKALPIPVTAARPIAEAISTAGGIAFESLDEFFMMKTRPGVFVAGEMLDWDAPTGGYLLTACFATGRAAARGVLAYLGER